MIQNVVKVSKYTFQKWYIIDKCVSNNKIYSNHVTKTCKAIWRKYLTDNNEKRCVCGHACTDVTTNLFLNILTIINWYWYCNLHKNKPTKVPTENKIIVDYWKSEFFQSINNCQYHMTIRRDIVLLDEEDFS